MSQLLSKSIYQYLLIIIVGALLFFPQLGQAHLFDWDEANFAEAAREMIVSGNWMRVQIDFLPFWEKPPLFIWLQAISMSIFGINEFAARFPNAVIGITTLCSLFYVGKKVHHVRVGFWWMLLYLGSWLPHFYFKSAIIDPLYNLLIFAAFYQLYNGIIKGKEKYNWLSGFFLGLAVLTKGPAAILIALLCLLVYIIWHRGLGKLKFKSLLWITLSCAITSFIWFGIDIVQNGWWFTNEFITYQIRLLTTQDAGHGGPFFYHFIVLLVGCFPAAVFLFQYNRKFVGSEHSLNTYHEFKKWMGLLLWVTLILFSIVKTKIIHYSSLCYFPLTYFAALEIYYLYTGQKTWKKITQIVYIAIGVILGILLILLPIVGVHIEEIKPYIDDKFFVANLDAPIQWQYAEMIIGLAILLVYIHCFIQMKKGRLYAYIVLFLANALLIETSVSHYAPKVEQITQGTAIDFFKSIEGENAVVYPLEHKSYAYLFYSNKQSATVPEVDTRFHYLMENDIDKDIYFITKNIRVKGILEGNPKLKLYKEENGYAILKKIND